jgi:hypothetical protein
VTAIDLGAGALWTLLPISVTAGIVAMIVFRWGTDSVKVRRATNLMLAHVLEFRLFMDEPVLVFRAQRELLKANLRLLRLVFLPCLILTVPFFFLIEYLNDWYGRAPLQPGRAAVITAEALNLPREIVVETPPLHFGGQLSWRVRPIATVPVRALKARNPHAAIPFPPATILRVHWLIWFSLFSSMSAIGLKCLE